MPILTPRPHADRRSLVGALGSGNGAYPGGARPGSKVSEIHGASKISERQRYRCEVNITYIDASASLSFEGVTTEQSDNRTEAHLERAAIDLQQVGERRFGVGMNDRNGEDSNADQDGQHRYN